MDRERCVVERGGEDMDMYGASLGKEMEEEKEEERKEEEE